jgi:hypothetical protein
MRRWAITAAGLLASCSEAAPEEPTPVANSAAPLPPLSLTALERGAPATVRRARDERETENLEARVRTAMEEYLFDPFSARFRSLRRGRGGAVCGEYNAKNRLGAYVGFKDFVLGRDGRTIYTSSYTDGVRTALFGSFAEAYLNVCATAEETRQHRIAAGPDPQFYIPTPADEAASDFYAAEGGYEDMDMNMGE